MAGWLAGWLSCLRSCLVSLSLRIASKLLTTDFIALLLLVLMSLTYFLLSFPGSLAYRQHPGIPCCFVNRLHYDSGPYEF